MTKYILQSAVIILHKNNTDREKNRRRGQYIYRTARRAYRLNHIITDYIVVGT